MTPKVTVIIAVYNCENYIERCVRSLFEQTLDSIETIFVNDATLDNSIKIIEKVLKDFPNRQNNVKIINLVENGGVSNARQIGLESATGDFVIHADSDDWMDNNMYERLYTMAKKTGADIVGCNFIHEFTDIRYEFHQKYADIVENNISNLINGKIFPSLCTSLTRRSIITENLLSFPKGLNMGEDLFFNLQLYLHCKKIIGIDWAPYHYRHVEDSSCVKRTRESIASDIAIADLIEKKMKSHGLYEKYAKDIEYRKFFSKLPLAIDLNYKSLCLEWRNIYPETNKNIWQYTQIDWKQKLILWLLSINMFPAAKLFQHFLEYQHKVRHL